MLKCVQKSYFKTSCLKHCTTVSVRKKKVMINFKENETTLKHS